MKKLLISLLAIVGMTLGANARDMNITASYGGYTAMDASDYHDGWRHVNTAWGAFNVGFNVKVLPKFWIGPSYTLSTTTTKGEYHSKIAYHAIMLNGRYDYYRNSIVTMYGHLGIGAVISHMQPFEDDSYNNGYFGYQVSPVGAEVGLSNGFAIFGELGFGVQGLLQVGFKINL